MKDLIAIALVLFASADLSAQGWEMLGPDSTNWRNVRRITGRWHSSNNFFLSAEMGGSVAMYSSGGVWDYTLRRNVSSVKWFPSFYYYSVEFPPWGIDSIWIWYDVLTIDPTSSYVKVPFPFSYAPQGGATIGQNCIGGSFTMLISEDSTIYATTCELLRSDDRGVTWQTLQDPWSFVNGKLIAMDERSPDVLYKTGGYFQSGTILFRSVDRGATWDSLFAPVPDLYNGAGVNVLARGDTILVSQRSWWNDSVSNKGIFRTSDGGSSWVQVYSASRVAGLVRSSTSDVILAASEAGILQSEDAGLSWTMFNNGLPTSRLTSLLADPYSDTLYVSTETHGVLKVWNFLVSVDDMESLPASFALAQNYPNPFNPLTNIKFQIPNSNFVSLKIFNVLGQNVQTLVNEKREAGEHSVQFDATGLSSGVYFYRLEAGSFVEQKKMLLLK